MISSNASTLAGRAPAHFKKLKQQLDEELERTRQGARDGARRRAPVDTGELRASIHIEGDSVVADAPHAAYVHEGTIYVESNPFLEEAAIDAFRDSVRRLRSR